MSANDTPMDGWSFIHFAAGWFAARAGLSPAVAAVAAITYEIVEVQVESSLWGQKLFNTTQPEIASNQVLDLVAFWAGYQVGKR